MQGNKLSLKEALQSGALSYEQMMRAVADGHIDSRKKYTVDELKDVLSIMNNLISDTSSEDTGNLSDLDIHLIKIRMPGTNIIYLTLMKDGKVVLTKNKEGKLDLSNPQQGLDHLADVLAWHSMFEPNKRQGSMKRPEDERKPKGDKPKKTKDSPTFKPTKEKPGYVRDPIIDKYFMDNADPLSYAAWTSALKYKKGQVIKGREGLEQVITDKNFLDKIDGLGMEIEAEPLSSFLASKRGLISSKTRRLLDSIIEKEEVRMVAGRYLANYIEEGDNERVKLRKLCESAESVQEIYKNLVEERDKIKGDDKGEHYVIAFRELALRILFKTGKISEDEFQTYKSNTRKWVGLAKAADFIKNNDYIKTNIIPGLREREENERIHDKIFNAMCNLGKMITNPEHTYDKIFVGFIIDGLWMEGLMEKKLKDGEITIRTVAGAKAEYRDGLANLMEHYNLYHKLLSNSFNKMLKEGKFDNGLSLEKTADCSGLGLNLYNELSPDNQSKFTRIKNSQVLKSTGTYITRLLRAYVGINRDYFTNKVEQKRKGLV